MFEPAYFSDNRVRVTAEVVELGSETYSVADIEAADLEQIYNPDLDWLRTLGISAGVILVLILGLRFLLPLLGQPVIGFNDLGIVLLFAALGTTLFAALMLNAQGKIYYVALEGSFGMITAVPSRNKEYVVKVTRAIRQALQETAEQGSKHRIEDSNDGMC